MVFQSAPLVRAATVKKITVAKLAEFQSAPLVRAATERKMAGADLVGVSIRAARESGDSSLGWQHGECGSFNPRRS